MNKKSKNLKKEIDEEIEIEIERRVKNLDKIIGPEIDKQLSEVVKKRVDQKTEEVLGRRKPPVILQEITRSRANYNQIIKITSFAGISECSSGYCRIVFFVSLACYILIAFVLFSCSFFASFYCISVGPFSGSLAVMAIAVVGLVINFIISLISVNPRPPLLFSIIMDIPLLIALLVFSFSYIAMFIIFFVIFIRFIQDARR
jgi:hypothetical protein